MKRLIVCNYSEATKAIPKGAKAFVQLSNGGNGHNSICILVRSRGGRWISKWERIHRLSRFRIQSVWPENPMYWDDRLSGDVTEPSALLTELMMASVREKARVNSHGSLPNT